MAKAKKTAPKKSARKSPPRKRPASAPDANLLADLLKWAKAAGADAADALYVNGEFDLGRPAHGRAREAREQRGPRPRPARVRGPAPGLRLLDRFRAHGAAHAGAARRRHGARGAGGPGMRHRPGGTAGPQLARPRSRRQAAAVGQGAAGAGRRSRGRRPRRQGRHQFRGRRGELEPLLGGAGRQQRLLRRLSPQRLFAVLRGAGRRGHRHGARL